MDPALMQQILGASQLGEQQQSTGNELADLIARRRAFNADEATTGLGALFGRISDMIMGRKEGDLRSRQADLAKQIAGVRGQYGNAWLGTPMGPQAPPGMPDSPPMIPPSAADQSQLATLGELSGDSVMAKVGQGALARMQQAPKLALETQQARKAQQETDALDTPEAGAAMRVLLGKYGVQLPEGTPGATLRALMPTAEKGYAASESAAARREAAQQSAELRKLLLQQQANRFDVKTDQSDRQFAAKRLGALSDALNPFVRRGGLGNYTQGISRAQKLDALLVDPSTGQPKKLLTPQDMTEATIALQQLVAAGHASQSEVEQLTPKSAGSDSARLLQYFTGKPWDAKQQIWAARMLHTAAREADTNRTAILQAFKQQLPQFSDIRELRPQEYEAALKAAGINPAALDASGLPLEGADVVLGTNPMLAPGGGAGGSSSGAAALRKKYGL